MGVGQVVKSEGFVQWGAKWVPIPHRDKLVCVNGTHHEGDMAFYWLQLILNLNLRANTHERGGIWTRAPDLSVQYP